jgi:hypothetical protein
MACLVKDTPETRAAISKYLVIEEKLKYYQLKKHIKPKVLVFYQKPSNGYIKVPYFIGRRMTKTVGRTYLSDTHVGDFSFQLREYQKPVIEEAESIICRYGALTLRLPPGFGKTIIILSLLGYCKRVGLVLVHRQPLMKQFKNTLERYYQGTYWIVEAHKQPPPETKIIVCMRGRIKHVPQEWLNKVGAVFIDEVYYFCTPTSIPVILSTTPDYLITASAEPRRPDNLDLMNIAMAGTKTIDRLNNKSYYLYRVNTGYKVRASSEEWDKVTTELMYATERNEQIVSIVNSNPDKRILILALRVEHTSILEKELKEASVSVDTFAGSKSKFKYCRVLIVSSGKGGVGFDEDALCEEDIEQPFEIIIMVNTTINPALWIQWVGRIRHPEPHIIVLIDDFRVAERHWRIPMKWAKKQENIEVYKVSDCESSIDDWRENPDLKLTI